MIPTPLDAAGHILWNYLKLHQQPEPADCIVGMGSHDIRVAERAAELFLQGYAPLLVFSGGRGRLTPLEWTSEAEVFAQVAIRMGVPEHAILTEKASTNTGENVRFTKTLLEEKVITVQKILFIHKPYMERRAYATFRQQWPEVEIVANSPQLSFDQYPNDIVSKEEMLNVMVGDLQRIQEYPSQGFQITQEIPPEAWEVFSTLVSLGYKKYIL